MCTFSDVFGGNYKGKTMSDIFGVTTRVSLGGGGAEYWQLINYFIQYIIPPPHLKLF